MYQVRGINVHSLSGHLMHDRNRKHDLNHKNTIWTVIASSDAKLGGVNHSITHRLLCGYGCGGCSDGCVQRSSCGSGSGRQHGRLGGCLHCCHRRRGCRLCRYSWQDHSLCRFRRPGTCAMRCSCYMQDFAALNLIMLSGLRHQNTPVKPDRRYSSLCERSELGSFSRVRISVRGHAHHHVAV